MKRKVSAVLNTIRRVGNGYTCDKTAVKKAKAFEYSSSGKQKTRDVATRLGKELDRKTKEKKGER